MARQKETQLQKQIVEALNLHGCRVFRIKNTGTYDPTIGSFRASSTEKGIPDILGTTKGGMFIGIEVKWRDRVDHKKISTAGLSEEQVEILNDLESKGALVGVAFTVEDALSIAMNDPEKYPRNKRTYAHRDERGKHNGKKAKREHKELVAGIAELEVVAEKRKRFIYY